MLTTLSETFSELITRGGVVMWPLLGLSLLSVTLLFERVWFFIRANNPGRLSRARAMARRLREDDRAGAKAIAQSDSGLYSDVVVRLLDEPASEAAAMDVIESQRPRLERFMSILSTIITVAPMLGILGTVLGIISSFELLSDQAGTTDPRTVSQGISEALLTTAVGLVIAIFTLFPYNALRVQVDRSLAVIESLAWAAVAGQGGPINSGGNVIKKPETLIPEADSVKPPQS